MNNERFTQLFDEQVERCSNLLVKKNAEYSQGGDRLSNFRQPSSLMKMHPAEVAFCYDAKHIASIQKKVNSNTQLYKQAGNSIVVDCLMSIIKGIKWRTQ